MNKYIFTLLTLTSFSAWAQPNLDLLKGSEWKGVCRKVVNEANEEIKSQPYVRLQSSYSFQNGELIWWVKSYSDTACTKIHGGNKSTLKCDYKSKDPYANCKQTKRETSNDGITWESKPMVDHAGYPNILELKVKASLAKKNKVKITTIGESEDEDSEILSH